MDSYSKSDSLLNKQELINVIIPDAETDLTLSVIRCLGRIENIKTILIAKKTLRAKHSKYCDHFIQQVSENDIELTNIIKDLTSSFNNVLILPVTLDGFRFVAKNKKILSVHCRIPPIPESKTIDMASDKWRLYEIAKDAGVPVLPSFQMTRTTVDEILETKLPFPFLVKSRDRKGGFGFKEISNKKNLKLACDMITSKDEGKYIIQPLIDAIDYSLSVFCENGQIIAYTLWKALMYGGRKYSIPRCIEFVKHEEILKAGAKLLSILKWDGVADIDFVVGKNEEQFYLLELNARFWQTIYACMRAGVNFPSLMCLYLSGNTIVPPKQKDGTIYARPSAIPDLMTNKWNYGWGTGVVNAVKSIKNLMEDPMPEVFRKK